MRKNQKNLELRFQKHILLENTIQDAFCFNEALLQLRIYIFKVRISVQKKVFFETSLFQLRSAAILLYFGEIFIDRIVQMC